MRYFKVRLLNTKISFSVCCVQIKQRFETKQSNTIVTVPFYIFRGYGW
jgi:hypothetical protein